MDRSKWEYRKLGEVATFLNGYAFKPENWSKHGLKISEAALGHSSKLDGSRLSPHFTLGELCKTSVNSLDGNIPGKEEIENLKRLCPWLEELRFTYNKKYVKMSIQQIK